MKENRRKKIIENFGNFTWRVKINAIEMSNATSLSYIDETLFNSKVKSW